MGFFRLSRRGSEDPWEAVREPVGSVYSPADRRPASRWSSFKGYLEGVADRTSEPSSPIPSLSREPITR